MPSIGTVVAIERTRYINSCPQKERNFLCELYNLQSKEQWACLLQIVSLGIYGRKKKQALREKIRKLCQQHPKWVANWEEYTLN